jgi:hypothetical protein
MKRFLPLLFAVLAVALGGALPWLVSAHQDQVLAEQTKTYPTRTVDLPADIIQRFWLANGTALYVVLDTEEYALSPSALSEAKAAWVSVAPSLGLEPDGDRWTTAEVTSRMAVEQEGSSQVICNKSSRYTVIHEGSGAAAVLRTCQLAGEDGAQFTVVLDDATGKLLSFVYAPGDEEAVPVVSEALAQDLAGFCQDYYHLDVTGLYPDTSPNRYAIVLSNGTDNALINVFVQDGKLFFNDFS